MGQMRSAQRARGLHTIQMDAAGHPWTDFRIGHGLQSRKNEGR